jgi:hypothetical protein
MRKVLLSAVFVLAFVLALMLFLPNGSSGGPAPAAASQGPVVIELFTSQGCSSCPPADRLLSRLAGDPKLAGKVIPLAFHVDYWDYIGWQDPFASPRWSQRQKDYARAFRSNRIYTPQLVVDGSAECVGSQEREIRKRIGDALAAPPAGRVTLAVDPVGPQGPPEGHLRVKVGAALARAAGPRDLDVWVAVFQTGLVTPVGAGENASHTLHDDYVVRRLEKAFTLPGTAGAQRSGEIVLGLDKRWKVSDLGVAAFLQDPATLKIYGAYSTRI